MDPFPSHMLSDPTWQSAHMQQPPISQLSNQVPPHPSQKNISFLHFNNGQYQDAMSRVNSIFINSNIAGSNQAGLGNANPGISNTGLTPGATLSIPQTVSDVSSTSTSSVPSSDVDEARTNCMAIAPTSHFAAALGLCEGNNGDNESTHGNPFASLDSCKEDSIVSGNNDDFELPGSPEPNGDPAGKKRNRLRPEQTRRLMEIFERTPKPDSEMRKILGKQLEMTPRTVQIWFQNRRAKLKRESNTVNLMRNSVYAASGVFDSRNAHRLTYNRAYINRRPTGRVASDGYAHLRNISEFEPYPPNTVHGLTLQSPSQISIPLSLRVQPPFPTLNSAPASAYPGSEPQMFGNSAMGVPAGQAKQNGVPNSASDIGGIIPNLNPFINTGNSNDAMQASLPHSASFPYSAHATSFSPSAAVQSLGACAPQTSMQLPNGQCASMPTSSSHTRTRSFTADSHSLSGLGHIPSERDCSNPMMPHNGNMVLSPSTNPQHGLMNPHETAPLFGSSDGIPTAEALLESRRRHLNDLIIINQTQVARGMRTSDTSQSTHMPVSSSAAESESSSKPLLFSNLSSADAQSIGTLSAPAPSKPLAVGQSVADFIASISNNSNSSNAVLGVSITDSVECRNPLKAGTDIGNTSNSVAASMPVPPQSLIGSTTNSDMSMLFNMSNGRFNGGSLSVKPEIEAKALGGSGLPDELEHSLGGSDSNYQFLNNLLLDCNAFDFLSSQNNAGQEQLRASGVSEGLPQHVSSSTCVLPTSEPDLLDLSCTAGNLQPSQKLFTDAMLVNGSIAGSDSREGSNAPDGVSPRVHSANSLQNSSRSLSSSSSDYSVAMPNTAAETESFLIASTSNIASPSYLSQAAAAEASAFLRTSAPEPNSLQAKQSPPSQVSVARSSVPGQRDLMIEQLSYSTMQL